MSDQLQTLNSEYNTILEQYQQTSQNYINSINTTDQSYNFIVIPNTSFIGNSLNQSQLSTITDCQNLCSSTPSCSGATYNTQNQNCALNSGKGNIINSSNSTSSIVMESIYYSYQLQLLNQQLLDKNTEIIHLTNQTQPGYEKNIQMFSLRKCGGVTP